MAAVDVQVPSRAQIIHDIHGHSEGLLGVSRIDQQSSFYVSCIHRLAETAEAKVIDNLRNEAKIKDAAIVALTAKIDRLEDEKRCTQGTAKVARRHHPISTGYLKSFSHLFR